MSGTQMLLTLFLLYRLPLLLMFVLTHTYARTHTTYYTLCTVHAHTHMLIRSHTHTSLQVLETTDPDPEIVMGDQVVKMFGDKWYTGRITKVDVDKDDDTTLYHVVYEDDDSEDLSFKECITCRRAFLDKKHKGV